jgi:hypothetical protein
MLTFNFLDGPDAADGAKICEEKGIGETVNSGDNH